MAIFTRKLKKSSEKRADTTGDAQPILGILRKIRVTEKTANAAKDNKYSFVVSAEANKPQIRQVVSEQYGVTVEAVHVMNMPKKTRRRGRQIGYKAGFKKAIVTLADGQSIETQ